MTTLADRITVDPAQCGGRPCVRGLRIRVTDVLDLLASGSNAAQVIEELPDLELEDVTACLRFASRRLRATVALVLLALTLVAIPVKTQGPPGAPQAAEARASHKAAAMARADAAIAELQATLLARLKEELGKGGVTAAVTVCRDEARQLTAMVGAKHGVQIGRTSDRVRNAANAPRPWMSSHVAAFAGRKATDAPPAIVDLPDEGIGVLKPIGTADFCVMCHGAREAVAATIGPVLATSYPDDRAVGFAPGDLRGWFWVEAR